MAGSRSEMACSTPLTSGSRFSITSPPLTVRSLLSPLSTLITWLCTSLFASAHRRWKAWLAMNSPTAFLARPSNPARSEPASTRAGGGSEVSAWLSAASTLLVTAAST